MFSMNSKLVRGLSRLADLMVLNGLFLLTSLPVFTIGASSAAMYAVCFRMGTEEEAGILRTYGRAFRENFRQATGIWLLLLAGLLAAGASGILFLLMPGPLRFLFLFFVLLVTLLMFVVSYVFPLLSQFSDSIRNTMRNALILSLGYAPRSFIMAVLNALPVVLLLTAPRLFLWASILWLLLYFSLAAYVNMYFLKDVFQSCRAADAEK